jgi:hypothetical protein
MAHEPLQEPVCFAGGFDLLCKLHDEIVKLVHEALLEALIAKHGEVNSIRSAGK